MKDFWNFYEWIKTTTQVDENFALILSLLFFNEDLEFKPKGLLSEQNFKNIDSNSMCIIDMYPLDWQEVRINVYSSSYSFAELLTKWVVLRGRVCNTSATYSHSRVLFWQMKQAVDADLSRKEIEELLQIMRPAEVVEFMGASPRLRM